MNCSNSTELQQWIHWNSTARHDLTMYCSDLYCNIKIKIHLPVDTVLEDWYLTQWYRFKLKNESKKSSDNLLESVQ